MWLVITGNWPWLFFVVVFFSLPDKLIFFLEEYMQVEKPGLPNAHVILVFKKFQIVKHLGFYVWIFSGNADPNILESE